MTRLTVLTHVWNEEVLLRWWLPHHRRLFDHGVVIDYGSTDRSRELVGELCPGWEVRSSRNACFDAHACDAEVMAIEQALPGWKLVLNATEQLFCEDLRAYLAEIERSGDPVQALGIESLVMIDPAGRRGEPADPGQPLCLQRHHGRADRGLATRQLRFLHRASDGRYEVGRHATRLVWRRDPELRILWWGWSPYERLRARKLQIQQRIPDSDKRAGWGWQHLVTPEELDQRYLAEAEQARDLLEEAWYRERLLRLLAREPGVDLVVRDRLLRSIEDAARRALVHTQGTTSAMEPPLDLRWEHPERSQP